MPRQVSRHVGVRGIEREHSSARKGGLDCKFSMLLRTEAPGGLAHAIRRVPVPREEASHWHRSPLPRSGDASDVACRTGATSRSPHQLALCECDVCPAVGSHTLPHRRRANCVLGPYISPVIASQLHTDFHYCYVYRPLLLLCITPHEIDSRSWSNRSILPALVGPFQALSRQPAR